MHVMPVSCLDCRVSGWGSCWDQILIHVRWGEQIIVFSLKRKSILNFTMHFRMHILPHPFPASCPLHTIKLHSHFILTLYLVCTLSSDWSQSFLVIEPGVRIDASSIHENGYDFGVDCTGINHCGPLQASTNAATDGWWLDTYKPTLVYVTYHLIIYVEVS